MVAVDTKPEPGCTQVPVFSFCVSPVTSHKARVHRDVVLEGVLRIGQCWNSKMWNCSRKKAVVMWVSPSCSATTCSAWCGGAAAAAGLRVVAACNFLAIPAVQVEIQDVILS